MSKEMFITVGTSLFHSASWEQRGRALDLGDGYAGWLVGEALTSPEQRLAGSGAHTAALIERSLKPHNREEWSGYLPTELLAGDPPRPTAMRYSAELATLVLMAGEKSTLRDLLGSYAAIRLLADEAAPTFTVARHLACYFNRIAGKQQEEPAQVLPIDGLASTDPRQLLGDATGLPRLLDEIASRCRETVVTEVDVVITGGYKIYAAALAELGSLLRGTRPRLIYIYEQGNQLITFRAGRIRIGKQEADLVGRYRSRPMGQP